MLYVHNDDAVYIWWLEANDAGFVANLHTGSKNRAVIHRTRCTHMYPPTVGKVHTGTYPKACSRDRDEVERWLRENGGFARMELESFPARTARRKESPFDQTA